jgi:putative hydrolase of the HAD superfamily
LGKIASSDIVAGMAPRGYLFDYGGTLDGEGWHWFDRTVHLYREAGCRVPVERLREAFYAAEEAIAEEARRRRYRLRPLVERHFELQAAILGDEVRRFSAAVVEGFCAMTEEGWRRSRALLSRLQTSARLGVVSNFYGNLGVLLDEARLSPLLDVVVESALVGVEKPDPEIYRIATRRLGIPAAQVIMVGDNFARDVRPARAAGLHAIWLTRGGGEPPEAGVADRVISRLDELAPPAEER